MPAMHDDESEFYRRSDRSRTAFGEVNVAENFPYIQAAPTYNFLPSNFRAYTSGTGSATVQNRMFNCQTGAGVGGYGAIQSFRSVNYKPGEGGMARFTALFETSVANSWQGVGLVNLGDELSFGYNGTAFGIWHRSGGVAEVRTLTITTASGGATDATLTLNDTAYTIPLTSGASEAFTAYEIAAWLNANQSVWHADQQGDDVIISALSDAAKSGTYSFSHATAAGTIAQTTAGVTKTSTHIPQSAWNGKSANWLKPEKGNVYQIEYQYLGFGDIRFLVEDPENGRFQTVHVIKYANANTSPSLGNPSLRLGMYCVSLGSTTNLTVKSGSMAGFTQGKRVPTRNPRSATNTQTISTTMNNILTIRNRKTYNGYNNQVELEPYRLTVANEGSKSLQVEIRATTSLSNAFLFEENGTNLVSDISTTDGVQLTGGRLLGAFTVAGGASETFLLAEDRIRIPPTLNLVVQAVKGSGGTGASATATLTWYEDV